MSYSFDPIDKTLNYHVKATVKKWFITKHIDKTGTIPVSPDDFLSENFRFVGKILRFGPLRIYIQSVKDNTAKGEIEADQADLKGHASYDLTEKYVSLISMQATGQMMGVTFNLNIQKED